MSTITAPAPTSYLPRVRGVLVAELGVLLFFCIVMALPITFMLAGSFNTAAPGQPWTWGFENWIRAFSDPQTLKALWMSFLFSVVRLIPSLTLSVIVAWLIARTDMPGGNTVEFLCWFAYFVPDFPLTLAWILLLDPHFGFLNMAAQYLPFVNGPLFNPYSFWGIVWVHLGTGGIWLNVMLLTPVFRRLGASLEEAARVSGANTFTTLWRITFPVLSPMILAIAVLSFIKGLESFNTELLLGLPARIYVYGTRIYDYLRQEPPAYGEATALGSVFLIVLFVLAFFYRSYLQGKKKFTVVTGQGYSTLRVKLGKWRYVAIGGFAAWFIIMMILPLTFLVIGSFMRRYGFFNISHPFTLSHWQNLLGDPLFVGSLQNSLIIATTVAILGILLYSIVGYLLASRKLMALRQV
jgi:iron(III) transport system permease protein